MVVTPGGGTIEPVGAAKSFVVDVRVIAATNKRLEDEIAKFSWLHEQDVLSKDELEGRLAQARSAFQAPGPAASSQLH